MLLPSVAYAADPYAAAKDMLNADVEAMTVYHLCGETIGLPALYETHRLIAINDIVMAGESRSDAVILIDKIVKKHESDTQRVKDETTCQKFVVDADRKLDYARAVFKKAAGIE
jgi:hypothetical protein